MNHVPIDEVVHFDVITSNPSTGAASDADSTPTFSVYEEDNDTSILGPTNLTKRTSLTGNYRGSITCSAANGFEAGKWYSVIASATVSSVAGKAVALSFRAAPAESAAGVPKVDASHVAGTSQTAGDIIADTNDIQSRLPAALVSGRMDASVGAMAADVLTAAATASDFGTEVGTAVWATATRTLTAIDEDNTTLDLDATIRAAVGLASANLDTQLDALPTASEINTEVDTALADIRLDELLAADSDIDGAAPPTVGSVFHELMSKTAGSFTFDQTTDSLEALRDNTGTAGAGLSAVPWNAAWDAEVQSEVNDGLIAYGAATATDVTTAAANVSVDEIQATALADLFNTDSGTTYASAVAGSVVKEIADNAGGSGLTLADIADAVWDEALSGHLSAGSTGEALNAAGAAGDPWITALPGSYTSGQAGYIVGTNLNATVSSRATQTSVDTIDGIVDSILVDTGTDIPATLATIAGYVDTEVAAIKAKTDNLPSDPADASVVAGLIAAVEAKVDIVDGIVDQILVDTGTDIPASIDALPTAAEINAEVVDALATDTYAEPGQGAPGATISLSAKLGYLYKAWRNKSEQDAAEYRLYNDNESTVGQKAAVSDDTTTFTRGEVGTGA